MLRIHGKAVSYNELLGFLKPPESGNSLEELRIASEKWGLRTLVYRTNPSGFDRLETPFIVHQNNQSVRHYLLVVSHDDANVTTWNPESGAAETRSRPKFFRAWTGYALATGTKQTFTPMSMLIVVQAALALVLGSYVYSSCCTPVAHDNTSHNSEG